VGEKPRPTGSSAIPILPDELSEIERGLTRIVRWGNLPRVRERFVAAAGMALDRSSFALLIRLDESGPARLSDLAQRVALDLSTASRQVQHLHAAGLVDRSVVEEDRRAALLTITPKGREMVERVRGARRAVMAELLAEWPPGERAELARLLGRLADDMVAFGCQER
jgi:DNA-binding MarR family transcriptional regulator